jgi:hypothetical protein
MKVVVVQDLTEAKNLEKVRNMVHPGRCSSTIAMAVLHNLYKETVRQILSDDFEMGGGGTFGKDSPVTFDWLTKNSGVLMCASDFCSQLTNNFLYI